MRSMSRISAPISLIRLRLRRARSESRRAYPAGDYGTDFAGL